ncbi:HsdR family type I site-specific deoxyribonuclease [Burkholderia pseudomallei]|uniref:type I restriction endonuclease subunit R n=1 Tax=Burkholderia pseudomallei TaxID=28450 RepID=UPI000F4F98AF|nr:HsdR family type I site-specific deoxyribonuclease [Burkholderia pseudomallei]RPE15432.1 type I restriction endonuclease subunit R [Burkholderia pseudomallei]RPE20053.1 type I restriction endonuclease subunit R [Burkholderia pseudomallei]RQS89240.1 type I restriction endonuclease subunit R [Burkholderia pseudomallei]RQZ48811.1 type I restriction endonuclease subunit R [Burkholderia pseudomallei]RSK62196.1 HsdR family type I site-specific deoxyribonuclease [Burkholderia pseudomallei]
MSEYSEVEQPFLQQLASQGWTVIDQGTGIPQDAALSLRANFRQWLLPEVFSNAVRAINCTDDGREWLTDRQLEDLVQQLLRQPNRTVLEANEAIQALLFKAQVDSNELTGEADPVVRLIDFHTPENNQFHAINQFRIDTPGCVKAFMIPDIVLFVNGIPLCVVECKKGSETCANPMQEAFVQLQRYMRKRMETENAGLKEGEPRLFHSNLMLIRSCGLEADYGTITSGEEHFYAWKTLYPQDDTAKEDLNAQQLLIAGMLTKPNLLQILRTSAVFMDTDGGPRVKVVCRYQQFRAAGKILQRLREGETAMDRSGVVWHTQGSGKSLTMVFLARMIRASRDLNDYKIVLVNDRQDLEVQLGETATLIGGRVNVIESRMGLRAHLSTDSSDVNMVMVHKFQEHKQTLTNTVAEALGTYLAMPSGKTFGVVNTSERIILMIDEAHRTQSSDLGDNLFEAFPNAARIAFTGTPLITERHGEKKTHKRFGEYIDTYRLLDAVNDGATLQILYEGKTADSALNEKHAFDEAFEDLFRDRSDEELLAIKKKYGATGDILEAENRINAIARDLVAHYVDNILPNGFKAQVVCHSKLACVRYQAGIEAALAERIAKEQAHATPDAELLKRLRFLKTAVVVSSDGTNEPAYITHARKQAQRMNAVENFCRSFDLEDPDKENTGVAFLIVCDMLLTGFDAPIEQVMYIDKKLREHTLLQAIARTNRVKKGKQRGYIVDYIGLANHLTDALTLYAASDELQELHDGMQNITSELPVLDERYQRLLQQFTALGVKQIKAFVNGELPNLNADAVVVHEAVKALKDEKQRADFEVYFKKFLMSMDIILPHNSAQPYRVPAKRFGYILQVCKERYKDESLNLGSAGEKVKALINEHLISLGINPKVAPVELLAEDFLEKLAAHAGNNSEAKASEMEHAIRKHCTVHHDEDPAFFKSLSEKVDALIEKHHDEWDLLAEKLAELRIEAVAGRQKGEDGMSREATTFYEHIIQVGFSSGFVDDGDKPKFKSLMESTVEILQETIASIDFWQNPDKQKRVRGMLKTEITKTGIEELKQNRERVAVEIMKLAKNRHDELTRGGQAGGA